jgi:hypothetical protein
MQQISNRFFLTWLLDGYPNVVATKTCHKEGNVDRSQVVAADGQRQQQV